VTRISRAQRRGGGGDLDLEQARCLGRCRGREQRHQIVGMVDDQTAVRVAELRDAGRRDARGRGERLARRELGAGAFGDAEEVGGVVHVPSS
jgi:hypothetical protein